jgi:uncharacterized repeat protein (TIGR01451 family)
MNKRKLISTVGILGLSVMLVASIAALAQAAPAPDVPTRSDDGINSQPGGDEIFTGNPFSASAAPEFISAVQLLACDTYYFRNQTQSVGSDGQQRIAITTPPTSGTPTVASTLIVVPALYVEIIRFYSHPALTADLNISGTLDSIIWAQTNSFQNTTFRVQAYDYDPANGNTTLLDEVTFGLLSSTVTDVELSLDPAQTTIVSGHRLLFVVSARSTGLLPTVNVHYDSTNRPSQFIVCHPTPANLTISKTGPAAVVAGEPITYTLTITNTGGTAATNVAISDTIPAGATYVSGGTKLGNEVTWTVPTLAPDTSLQQVFVVTAAATIVNNDYQVSADDNLLTIGQTAVTTIVSQPGDPNLLISKNGPTTAKPGEAIVYTLTVVNNGDTQATNLVISDTIPAGANYVSGGTKTGGEVRWTVGSLAPEASIERTFTVTASATITNSVYQVVTDNQAAVVGLQPVVTAISDELGASTVFYLPFIFSSGSVTRLIVQSINTGGINPVLIQNPTTEQQLLSCVVEANVTQKDCSSFSAIGQYKIIAHTANCGILQGVFNDAVPGATITRQIECH